MVYVCKAYWVSIIYFLVKSVPIVLAELEKSGKSGNSGSTDICVGSCLSSPSESKKKIL